MTAYFADRALSGVIPESIFDGGDQTVTAVFTLTAALANTDTVTFMTIPNGAYIDDLTVTSSIIDSGVGNAFRFSLGDSNAAGRYMTAVAQPNNTTGLVGTKINVFPTSSPGGLTYGYLIGTNTGDGTIILTVTAGPTTGNTSGVIVLTASYSFAARTATS